MVLTIVNGSKNRTVLSMDQFCDQQRRRAVGDCNAEAQEEARCHKHVDIDRDGLENNAKKPTRISFDSSNPLRLRSFLHDQAANDDTSSAAENIGSVRNHRNGHQ